MSKDEESYSNRGAKEHGLETGAGYRTLFLQHRHYGEEPFLKNHFKEGTSYVTLEVAIKAIKRAEVALKEKYKIK